MARSSCALLALLLLCGAAAAFRVEVLSTAPSSLINVTTRNVRLKIEPAAVPAPAAPAPAPAN